MLFALKLCTYYGSVDFSGVSSTNSLAYLLPSLQKWQSGHFIPGGSCKPAGIIELARPDKRLSLTKYLSRSGRSGALTFLME